MKVGITGTQIGCTGAQLKKLDFLIHKGITELHHGDCVGVDEESHEIALKLSIDIIIHPPDKSYKRAFCEHAVETREPFPYLVRNENIVKETDLLIAVPKGYKEEVRSGTWYTVRRAREKGIPIKIIHPNGNVIHG